MKTIKSILLALVLVSVTSLTAATKPADDKTVIQRASEEIGALLKNPSFQVTEKLTAQISLIVNSDNELVVLSVQTDNEELEHFVKERLNYQKVSYGLVKGREYKLPLTIRSES